MVSVILSTCFFQLICFFWNGFRVDIAFIKVWTCSRFTKHWHIFLVDLDDAFDMNINRIPMMFHESFPYHTPRKDLGLDLQVFEGSTKYVVNRQYYNYGFKVFIHSPYEFPDENLKYFTISLNQSYTLLITPQLRSIDDSLINMSPDE